jgi:uncharacterized metal-binding protein YceD (DUF177 family)
MKGSSRHGDALEAREVSPLTRPVAVDSIKAAGQHMDVTLGEGEAASLAKFLGLASIERLKARYKVTRNGDHAAIKGTLEAEVHQICVVSLEPFPVKVREDVAMKFAPESEIEKMEARLLAQSEDSSIDLGNVIDADNFPEPVIDGRIDLGAATTEFLSLALPPYPRKPGVVFAEAESAGERQSPFAVLARLKQGGQQ